MFQTLLLDLTNWDLVLDANNNIAVASAPYSLAQDAASAIQTFLGDCFLDTTLGIPYLTQIFGHNQPLSFIKQQLVTAALTVPDVVSAECFISSVSNRGISGQVQVTSATTGQVSVTTFSTVNPQGTG
jgi:hypothetical protein